MEIFYTASAVATGDGRNGHVQSTDGFIDTDVRVPRELGGAGGATNPEQLFAAGYAACFHSALQLVAGKAKLDVTDSEVVADVSIGANGVGGFGLAIQLEIALPGPRPGRGREAGRAGTPGLPLLQRHPRQRRRHADPRLSDVIRPSTVGCSGCSGTGCRGRRHP